MNKSKTNLKDIQSKRKISLLKILCKCLVLIIFLLLIFVAISLYILYNSTINLKKIDDEGYLYYIEYIGNYDSFLVNLPVKLVKGGGCSSFVSKNEKGEVITGRNYDLPHLDKSGNITGLNLVIKLNGKGKYKSLNLCDAGWLTYIGLPYYKGFLDKSKYTKTFLGFLPVLCMDGINEKGLVVSVNALDLKEGEKPVHQKDKNKKEVVITQLLRILIDNCANVQEAIDLTRTYNLVSVLTFEYHLFITDASGDSVVLEWRNNELIITYTDISTNFYVSSEDATDCYIKGVLKEEFIRPDEIYGDYKYGYGHGYERFFTIAKFFDSHKDKLMTFETQITHEEAKNLLINVSQEYIEGFPTSLTQYSVIYNNNLKKLDVYVFRNYTKYYSFDLNE